eukprot:TRINITY_DN10192_c0_g1_i1.p1 TRINITY_DN10192_c0_g1~~TRINITY_DN10192_c0_g1_i1.p1  ORF type:complete len:1142 (+),score=318.13 TRINITY_DN10192_c0_g1_i1:107-3532(+)
MEEGSSESDTLNVWVDTREFSSPLCVQLAADADIHDLALETVSRVSHIAGEGGPYDCTVLQTDPVDHGAWKELRAGFPLAKLDLAENSKKNPILVDLRLGTKVNDTPCSYSLLLFSNEKPNIQDISQSTLSACGAKEWKGLSSGYYMLSFMEPLGALRALQILTHGKHPVLLSKDSDLVSLEKHLVQVRDVAFNWENVDEVMCVRMMSVEETLEAARAPVVYSEIGIYVSLEESAFDEDIPPAPKQGVLSVGEQSQDRRRNITARDLFDAGHSIPRHADDPSCLPVCHFPLRMLDMNDLDMDSARPTIEPPSRGTSVPSDEFPHVQDLAYLRTDACGLPPLIDSSDDEDDLCTSGEDMDDMDDMDAAFSRGDFLPPLVDLDGEYFVEDTMSFGPTHSATKEVIPDTSMGDGIKAYDSSSETKKTGSLTHPFTSLSREMDFGPSGDDVSFPKESSTLIANQKSREIEQNSDEDSPMFSAFLDKFLESSRWCEWLEENISHFDDDVREKVEQLREKEREITSQKISVAEVWRTVEMELNLNHEGTCSFRKAIRSVWNLPESERFFRSCTVAVWNAMMRNGAKHPAAVITGKPRSMKYSWTNEEGAEESWMGRPGVDQKCIVKAANGVYGVRFGGVGIDLAHPMQCLIRYDRSENMYYDFVHFLPQRYHGMAKDNPRTGYFLQHQFGFFKRSCEFRIRFSLNQIRGVHLHSAPQESTPAPCPLALLVLELSTPPNYFAYRRISSTTSGIHRSSDGGWKERSDWTPERAASYHPRHYILGNPDELVELAQTLVAVSSHLRRIFNSARLEDISAGGCPSFSSPPGGLRGATSSLDVSRMTKQQLISHCQKKGIRFPRNSKVGKLRSIVLQALSDEIDDGASQPKKEVLASQSPEEMQQMRLRRKLLDVLLEYGILDESLITRVALHTSFRHSVLRELGFDACFLDYLTYHCRNAEELRLVLSSVVDLDDEVFRHVSGARTIFEPKRRWTIAKVFRHPAFGADSPFYFSFCQGLILRRESCHHCSNCHVCRGHPYCMGCIGRVSAGVCGFEYDPFVDTPDWLTMEPYFVRLPRSHKGAPKQRHDPQIDGVRKSDADEEDIGTDADDEHDEEEEETEEDDVTDASDASDEEEDPVKEKKSDKGKKPST